MPLTSRTVTDAAKLKAVLGRVKAQGFALVDQELEEGQRSAAAPCATGRRAWWRR